MVSIQYKKEGGTF